MHLNALCLSRNVTARCLFQQRSRAERRKVGGKVFTDHGQRSRNFFFLFVRSPRESIRYEPRDKHEARRVSSNRGWNDPRYFRAQFSSR